LRFPGQYFDAETGLHYNMFRDFNPQTGRYIESDPIGLDGGLNTYGYVGGNPLSRIDPKGTNAVAGAIEGAEAGGAVGGLPGAVVGGVAGAVAGAVAGDALSDVISDVIDKCKDDKPDKCEKAKNDARSRYLKLINKRLPHYLSGGTNGSDASHYRSIKELQAGLKDALRRVAFHCNPLPPEYTEWERVANLDIPILY
jgi:RHS repeat-associated protein